MTNYKDRELKKIGFPFDHPIPIEQVAHDLAVIKTSKEMSENDWVEDIYYRYYYNFDEFMSFFEVLKEKRVIEIPLLKELKP